MISLYKSSFIYLHIYYLTFYVIIWRGSHSGCSGTYYINQASLELRDLFACLCPLPSKCWRVKVSTMLGFKSPFPATSCKLKSGVLLYVQGGNHIAGFSPLCIFSPTFGIILCFLACGPASSIIQACAQRVCLEVTLSSVICGTSISLLFTC